MIETGLHKDKCEYSTYVFLDFFLLEGVRLSGPWGPLGLHTSEEILGTFRALRPSSIKIYFPIGWAPMSSPVMFLPTNKALNFFLNIILKFTLRSLKPSGPLKSKGPNSGPWALTTSEIPVKKKVEKKGHFCVFFGGGILL